MLLAIFIFQYCCMFINRFFFILIANRAAAKDEATDSYTLLMSNWFFFLVALPGQFLLGLFLVYNDFGKIRIPGGFKQKVPQIILFLFNFSPLFFILFDSAMFFFGCQGYDKKIKEELEEF